MVREIAAISPGSWFHIGGDESHVTAEDDYIYFVNCVQDNVRSHGKKVIGWDEYKTRLADFGSRFEAMEIDFYRSDLVPWK